MEIKMKKTLFAMGAAALFAGSATAAFADAKMMMEGYAACNSSYRQCIKDGVNMSLASDPKAGAEQVKMNMMHSQECAAALQACYKGVK
jgi:hypothetical protein